ncbi:lipocalin [Tabrizicola soli]|uniref:Lipocalin n=1 Tax=Tabrizicola soli TaxID=2185115 RepID=A0ABV7DUE5_9RHOB
MHRLILAALVALAACAPAPQKVAGFRDPATPVWSAAAFAPERAAGEWRQVASHARRPGGCASGAVRMTPAQGGLAIDGTLCIDGEARPVHALARPAGPGRLALAGQEDWWILWVDEGYRTLAIGTPSGRFGLVLDRGAIPPDRLAAARAVFDFNGYNPAAFRPF